ncbi:MAG: YafY family protein [Ilumatobacteraceae bacterium]
MTVDDVELGTTGRLLAALSLLQARPQWTGPELADRLGVTVRTVRRDVDRLRDLGYPVVADVGVTGGYRLGAGGRTMPPLMLDRDEAVAVAVCLRSTATDSIAGGGEAAIRALGKLEQLLPPTLRRQVGTIGSMTARLGSGGAPVSPDVLVTITRACRDSERLRVRYRDARGHETDRVLDPHRVVSTAKRWYLVARDRDRADWRTWRVDRIVEVEATGHRVDIVDPPDPVAFVQAAITVAPYRHRAVVELAAPITALTEHVPPTVGLLEPIDEDRTLLTTGGDSLDLLTFHVLSLGVDFHVRESAELRDHMATAARRLSAATSDRPEGAPE